ncbi:MAG TPA: nucleotide sugar dehydrogenase, partial [Patescibacteria group bacterium]|nr:nucleotide sugar dehydrogenase [Patescibacteria group bacterium]
MSENKQFDICIIGGCGHVGLPLGLAFAQKGKRVVLQDIHEPSTQKINNKIMPFLENGAQEILTDVVERGLLSATTDRAVIKNSEHIIVVVGTPVDEHLNPRIHDVTRALDDVMSYFQDDQVIILRSTLYPGTSEQIQQKFIQQGKKTGVAFCPER